MSRKDFEGIEPMELNWTKEGHMAVLWSDAHRSEYTPAYLRSICPCAECTGAHGTPPKAFNILSSQQLATAHVQTVIQSVEPVGNYAVQFTWGDGHAHGIYSWPFLRASTPRDRD